LGPVGGARWRPLTRLRGPVGIALKRRGPGGGCGRSGECAACTGECCGGRVGEWAEGGGGPAPGGSDARRALGPVGGGRPDMQLWKKQTRAWPVPPSQSHMSWPVQRLSLRQQHGAVVARGAHNPEVTRSKRVAAILFCITWVSHAISTLQLGVKRSLAEKCGIV
jgi:hypothetical protein